MVLCGRCNAANAALKRPKTKERLCKGCFYDALESEVHETIVASRMFRRGQRVAVAASGGKDSTVLAHMLTTLNKRHDYGLDLFLLSIDEGISGYRDDSLETVKRNEKQYGIPLLVVSYEDLYGWTMDAIVRAIGTRNNCTFCGVFRRQALDRGAVLAGAECIATGHNADDVAETVLLNLMRGDSPRLARCADAVTGRGSSLPRVKPFKWTYEKEIVLYAHFKRLDYFSTECIYSPFAARGAAREYVKDLEAARPSGIADLIAAAEQMAAIVRGQPTFTEGGEDDEGAREARSTGAGGEGAREGSSATAGSSPPPPGEEAGVGGTGAAPAASHLAGGAAISARALVRRGTAPGACERCGYLTSQRVCKACVLLEGLNESVHDLGVGRRQREGKASGASSFGGRRAPVPDARSTEGGARWYCAETLA